MLIAHSHTLLKNHISALALYERAQTYLSKIPSSIGSIAEKDIPVTFEEVSAISTHLQSELIRAHSHVIVTLPNPNEPERIRKVHPLLMQLTLEASFGEVKTIS